MYLQPKKHVLGDGSKAKEVKQEVKDNTPSTAARVNSEVIELLSDTEDEEENVSQVYSRSYSSCFKGWHRV